MNYKVQKRSMLAAGCLLMLLLGSIFSWSVFKKPLQAAFGWNDSQLSWPFMICMIFFSFGNIIAAWASKRFRLRVVVWASGAIAVAGLVAASRTTLPWQLNASYGVCMGLSVGMSYNCVVTAGNGWFRDKAGTVTGVLMMSFGCGSLIFAPLDNYLLSRVGWSQTFLYMALAFAAVAGLAGLFICLPPEDYACPPPARPEDNAAGSYDLPGMLRRASFWLLLGWAVAVAVVGYSCINQIFMIACSVGVSDVAASLAVSLVSVCNGLGRVLSGRIFDRRGLRMEMGSMSVMLALSMLCLLPALKRQDPVLLYLGFTALGFGFGGGSPTIANAVRSFYGMENFAMNYSMMNFNSIFASLISQLISGYVLVSTGSYLSVVLCVSGVTALIIFLNILIKKP